MSGRRSVVQLGLRKTNSRFQPAEEIRKTARQILAESEFQHFQRFLRKTQDADSKHSLVKNRENGPESTRNPLAKRTVDERVTGNEDGSTQNDSSANLDSSPTGSATDNQQGADSTGSFLRRFARATSAVFGLLFHTTAWLTLLIISALIVLLIFTSIWASRGGGRVYDMFLNRSHELEDEETREMAPGDLPSDIYVTRARELIEKNMYREAIGELVTAAMCHIERRDWIRYRRGLTFRDYLRAVRGHGRQYQSFGGMIRLYEPIGFGRRPANRENFDTVLDSYLAGFDDAV